MRAVAFKGLNDLKPRFNSGLRRFRGLPEEARRRLVARIGDRAEHDADLSDGGQLEDVHPAVAGAPGEPSSMLQVPFS